MELGYPGMTDDLFKKFTSLLFRESGITLKDHKKYLVINRLSKYVGYDKEFKTFEAYYDALTKTSNERLMTDFVNVLTTNFSFFFREEIHFNFLKKYLSEQASKEPYVRIWSAASSTGEETYSIAISALQALQNINRLDFKILGTDISTRVLNTALTGIYHYTKIRGHIADNELKTYFDFDRATKDFIVKDFVKELITFRYFNLFDDYPFKKQFDIVFLRNVLIYFDNQEKEKVINKIYDFVKPNGYLIMGLSESLVGIKNPFVSIKNSIHQKKA